MALQAGEISDQLVGEDATPSPTRHRRWLVAVVLALLVFLGLGAAAALTGVDGSDRPALTVERSGPAPPFEFENVRPGQPGAALAGLRGRPAVLNVWASWCLPCRREMPVLAAAHQRYGARIGFVGVNHQDTRDQAIALLDETGVRYPSGYDPEGTVALDYGLFGMPTTIFISAEGELLEQRTGELTSAELAMTIDRLFLSE